MATDDKIRRTIARRFGEAFSEDAGWVALTPVLGLERPEDDAALRDDAVRASYYYARRDPLYSRAIQLIRSYTFGRGIAWRARDERTAAVLRAFWDDPDNALVARSQGQWELCERLLIVGEVFPALFVNAQTGAVKVSLVESREVQQVITSPDDVRNVVGYQRRWTSGQFDFTTGSYAVGEQRTAYYPDWRERQFASSLDDEGTRVCLAQVRVNSHGLRGLPPFYAAIPWVKAYKGFQEDRATLTLALATWAFKAKIKGGQKQVARLAGQLGRATLGRYGSASNPERERAEGAQTLIENDALTVDQIRTDSGASNAYQDGRMLRQQIAAATGITEPDLTGDPSIGNLASLTAMNGPQVKGFEAWQQLWADFYRDLFMFVLEQATQAGRLPPDADRSFEIDFPPIVTEDLPTLINAIAQLIQAQSLAGREFVPPQRLAARIIGALGETDVDQALSELEDAPTTNPAATVEPRALPDTQAEALARAVEALREAAGVTK